MGRSLMNMLLAVLGAVTVGMLQRLMISKTDLQTAL
jgi:hypothetical protein